MKRVIYAVDIGSPTAGLAWARLEDAPHAVPTGSADLLRAARRMAADLRAGAAVAIGLEAPGFLPVPAAAADLAKARPGDVRAGTSRPWSYGAGAYVTTMAIPIGAWLLRQVRRELGKRRLPPLTLDPDAWPKAARLLLWEAFVSGPGHARAANTRGVSPHVQDAATAAAAFRAWFSGQPRAASAVRCEAAIATFGAIALWSGWSTDVGLLLQQPLVIWPDQPLGANVLPEDVTEAAAPEEAEELEATTAAPVASATLALSCGDSHSLWLSHQTGARRQAFEVIVELLRASPRRVRRCDLSFDGGTSWVPLVLRLVSGKQISWKGASARASATARRPVLVRT